jgi:predicted phage replisome organizer
LSDNKKYYYLKLKETFYTNEDLALIEGMENGFIYSNLYLKMILLSLKDEGRLLFKGRIPYSEKMISTITRIPIDNVRCGIKILSDYGMIEILESGVMYMTDIQDLIGQGSTESERKAKYRKRINEEKKLVVSNGTKTGQCPGHRTPELELELELELDIEKEKEALPSPPEKMYDSGKQEGEFSSDGSLTYNHRKNLSVFQGHWNEKEALPKYIRLIINIPNIGEILDGMKVFTFNQIMQAIDNYAEIAYDETGKYPNASKYTNGFPAFLKLRPDGFSGIDKYITENDPWSAFKGKSATARGQPEETEDQKKVSELMRKAWKNNPDLLGGGQ